MLRRTCLSARIIGVIAAAALSCCAVAQETADRSENRAKHHYTLASLAGNYAITGVYGPHAAGFLGTTSVSREGVISDSSGLVVDPALGAPIELSPITGQVTVNPDGTGLFTLNVTFVGGQANVTFHLNFVITQARLDGNELKATRIVGLQQESSGLPGADFASLTLTRRPE